ncbi:MAG: 4Fe-4S binding protein [Thermodesulfobacteriota bacterium]
MATFRWLIQTFVTLGTNSYLLFPFGSVIYQGPLKAVCHPGLNCYSCPAALLSCPVGAIQNFLATLRFTSPGTWPRPGVIVLGYLGFIGTLVGRLPCGWLCPFGFIQDLLFKIPSRKFNLWPPLRWVKYGVLVVFVVLLPLLLIDNYGLGHPWFCKLICPSGTLLGALPLVMIKPSLWQTLGFYFWNKITILVALIILAIFISRFFCRVLCPLGAFYGLFSRVSLAHLEFIEGNCVECQACVRVCPTGVKPPIDPYSTECILCLKCLDACHFRALDFSLRRFPHPGRAPQPPPAS